MTIWTRRWTIGPGSLLLAGVIGCAGTTPSAPSVSGSGPSSGGTPSETASLLGRWRLLAFQEPSSPTRLAPAGTFTAEFRDDRQLSLVADCNLCAGTYAAGASSLEVKPLMACTLAACPSAPIDSQYVGLVIASKTWSVSAAGVLELRSERGALNFVR